jgi:hypothetical protein
LLDGLPFLHQHLHNLVDALGRNSRLSQRDHIPGCVQQRRAGRRATSTSMSTRGWSGSRR